MVDKAEDFVPDVEKIVGKNYTIEIGEFTGSVVVKKDEKVLFRIFKSMVVGGFIVRLDEKDHSVIAKKVADKLGIGFVD